MKLMQMLAATALLAASHLAYGQGETPVMTVNVPFAFTAAGVSLPAGHYVISRAEQGQLWRLRTFGHADVYLTATPRELRRAAANSSLLFDRDGSGYALRQIQEKAQIGAAQVLEPGRAKEHTSTGQQIALVTAQDR